MYIQRYLEPTIKAMSRSFKVIYLGGPRQVGKTTLLERLCRDQGISAVSLDDPQLRILAKSDPGQFLKRFPPPIFIDEVQYAPELFPYIKMHVDREQRPGSVWLSGSQHFPMIRGIQESLAGRVGIVSLLGISLAEELGIPDRGEPFLPQSTRRTCEAHVSLLELFEKIFRGSFPAIVSGKITERHQFYSSYVQTYIDRDVVGLFGVQKVEEFHRVLSLVAAHTGQMLNMSAIAKDASLSVSTVRSWLSILQSTGLVYFLYPFSQNITKRMVRAPKMYLLDTGLAAYLTRWPSAETLMSGAMAGAFFETFVVAELIKSYTLRGLDVPFYYYRDKDGREIDVLIQRGQTLFPVEIKMATRARPDDVMAMRYLRERWKDVGHGAIVCNIDAPIPINREVDALPISCII